MLLEERLATLNTPRLRNGLLARMLFIPMDLLYVLKPGWSDRLNAEFEDHAEHETMEYVAAHPEHETEPYECVFCKEYGEFQSVAHLLRRIAVDEREHKGESLRRLPAPRFGISSSDDRNQLEAT